MLRDLLAVEVVATVNVALCEYHQKHCPAAEQMASECAKVGPCWLTAHTHGSGRSCRAPEQW